MYRHTKTRRHRASIKFTLMTRFETRNPPNEQGQKRAGNAAAAAAGDGISPLRGQALLRRWSGEKLSPGKSRGDHHARYRKAIKSCTAPRDCAQARHRSE